MHFFCQLARLLLWFLAVALSGIVAPVASATQAVSLQLKWTHEFQFAGYYAARELGFYRDAGLEVTIREGSPSVNVVDDVISGRADFGTGSASLLLNRSQGQPVVVLAVIYQHSPYVLIAGTAGRTLSIHDLMGKRIMVEPLSEELQAYLRREGIGPEQVQLIDHSYEIGDLISGKADALSAYSTSEPFFLNQARFPYQVFSPRAAGIDFYGDNLFTSEKMLREHPDQVRAFREASLKGWSYAMAHPDEVIDIIRSKYTTKVSREFLQFEAQQSEPLILARNLELGYMYPGRWQHIADVYTELGMIPAGFQLNGFLYSPASPDPALTKLYRYLAIAITLVVLAGVIAGYILSLNKRLARSLASLNQANEELTRMAYYDNLTGVANRALFSKFMDQTMRRSRRNRDYCALLQIDLDHFKVVNDSLGHAAGDEVLREAAARIQHSLRESDMVGRVGGDEFVVLLSDVVSADAAMRVAEKIREALAVPLFHDGQPLSITASIGVAIYPEHGTDEITLSRNADFAMYRAKLKGRDRVRLYDPALEADRT